MLLVPMFGTAVRYFFQTDIVPTLQQLGATVVAIAPVSPATADDLMRRYPGLKVESVDPVELSRELSHRRFHGVFAVLDTLSTYVLQLGMGGRMNTAVVDSTRPWLRRRLAQVKLSPLRPLLDMCVSAARRSRPVRSVVRFAANATVPTRQWRSRIAKVSPDLVVTAGLGWSAMEYGALRESRRLGIPTAAVMSGWDHTSNRGIPRIIPDHTLTWSEVQKQELVTGSDVPEDSIEPNGSAHFDRYAPGCGTHRSRDEFFSQLGLDPERRLITFACTFVAISSNAEMVEALSRAVDEDQFGMPVQLLVRLHPTHLKSGGAQGEIVKKELELYKDLARKMQHVRLHFPDVEDGAAFNVASDADTQLLSDLLEHSDVLVTLFSTMALEASIKDVPTVTVAVAPTEQWRWEYTWDITNALNWPTHERILQSGATVTAYTLEEMVEGVRKALRSPEHLRRERAAFAIQETLKVDGQSGFRTGNRLYALAAQG